MITAVADFKGTFIQGTTGTLFLKITDFDGNPVDPETISITIRTESGSLIESDTPEKVVQGFYVFEWDIDSAQDEGDYVITWDFTRDGENYQEVETVTVAIDADDVNIYSGRAKSIRGLLEYYICCAQSIPVYYEQSKPTHNRRIYRFTFSKWNQTTGVKVYRNNNILTDEDDDVEVNYFKGEVVFGDMLTQYDMVHADYNFAWFSAEELNTFLGNAVADFNTFPPHSNYSLAGTTAIPDRFLPAVIRKAAADSIRQLMLCLQFQEPQQVFGGPDKAKDAFSNFETLKKNYEDEWFKLMENKKLGPYPRTLIISVPEYTLPGGRSRWFRYLFSSGV